MMLFQPLLRLNNPRTELYFAKSVYYGGAVRTIKNMMIVFQLSTMELYKIWI